MPIPPGLVIPASCWPESIPQKSRKIPDKKCREGRGGLVERALLANHFENEE
jgi:hypothetical protein